MKPEKALELVGRYSRLTKSIALAKKSIGDNLGLCKGVSGKRRNVVNADFLEQPFDAGTDSKGRDLDLHLTNWYTPDRQGDYGQCYVYEEIGEWSAEECRHCYAAHLAIQERKAARKSLGAVKAAMTRSAA